MRRIYEGYKGRKIISALFDWQGNLIEGDERIRVKFLRPKDSDQTAWLYQIEPFENYLFIRIPVNVGGVQESYGSAGEANPDAEYFRYIPVPDGRLYGGTLRNVKVSFMVFAYKPSDLLSVSKE